MELSPQPASLSTSRGRGLACQVLRRKARVCCGEQEWHRGHKTASSGFWRLLDTHCHSAHDQNCWHQILHQRYLFVCLFVVVYLFHYCGFIIISLHRSSGPPFLFCCISHFRKSVLFNDFILHTGTVNIYMPRFSANIPAPTILYAPLLGHAVMTSWAIIITLWKTSE